MHPVGQRPQQADGLCLGDGAPLVDAPQHGPVFEQGCDRQSVQLHPAVGQAGAVAVDQGHDGQEQGVGGETGHAGVVLDGLGDAISLAVCVGLSRGFRQVRGQPVFDGFAPLLQELALLLGGHVLDSVMLERSAQRERTVPCDSGRNDVCVGA